MNSLLKVISSALAGVVFLTAPAALADTIRIRADVFYPYNGDPQSDKLGYMIEVAKLALEPAGHKVDYQVMPWARALTELADGSIEAIVGASKADAPSAVFPAEPLGVLENHFFVSKDQAWRYAGVESLSKVAIGVIADYSYGEALDAYIKANEKDPEKVQALSSDTALEQNIKKLQAGRIGAVLEGQAVFSYRVVQMKLSMSDFVDAGSIGDNQLINVAFSAKYPRAQEAAKLISDTVTKLRESGELAKILAKYGLTDFKK